LAAQSAVVVVAANNLGAVVGMLLSGVLLSRFRSSPVLLPAFLLGAAFTAAVGQLPSQLILTLCCSALGGGGCLGAGAVGAVVWLPACIQRSCARRALLGNRGRPPWAGV